jgi:hypothetical protein
MHTFFDKLNRETFNHNNGISRNIDPTSDQHKTRASDLLANFNNYTYKTNNGYYPNKLYK